MSTNKLTIGYSPFGAPSHNPIYPFDQIYDLSMNLLNATESDIKKCDMLLLWGGSDISPILYGETPIPGSGPIYPTERDSFEWELIKQFSDRGIPIVGICRGAQMLCAAAGGKLIQHTGGHTGTSHEIVTYDDQKFTVSSDHHQMLYPYDVKHELLAWMETPKSTVYLPNETPHSAAMLEKQKHEPEVVFFDALNALAIQCHPEWHAYKHPFNEWVDDIILERFFD